MSYYANMNDSLTFKTAEAYQKFAEEMKENGYEFYVDNEYPLEAVCDDHYVSYDSSFFESVLDKYASDMEDGSFCSFVGEDGSRWRFIIDDGQCTEISEPDTDTYIAVMKNKSIIGFLRAESVSAAKKRLTDSGVDFDEVVYLDKVPAIA